MSTQTEALRQFFAAVNRNDMQAITKDFDPQITRVEPEGFPTSGTYRGIAEVQAHVAKGRGTWAEGSCEPEGFCEKGDKVVVYLHARVRLKDSTDWIDGRFADGFAFRNGRITQYLSFGQRPDALKWAGIDEREAVDDAPMSTREQIDAYIAAQPESKRSDMQALHGMILKLVPGCKLWFLDGKDEKGRTVSNPNIGYGSRTQKYADGKTREFYQIGISANTTGISVYILGIEDKKFLAATFAKELGKASVTGYCIKFKTLKGINVDALKSAMEYGIEQTGRAH